MNLNELKKGFWGYKRESVYEFISNINEEFSQKLIEKDNNNEKHLKELKDRIAELELELSVTKKENETYQKMQYAVSNSIIEAQNYALEMKNETKKIEMNLRTKADERYESETKKLDEYSVSIENIRKVLKETLSGIDSELQDTLSDIKNIKVDFSARTESDSTGIDKSTRKGNMTLFQRNENAN